MKKLLTLLAWVIPGVVVSQNGDCPNAIPICQNTYSYSSSAIGGGSIAEAPSSPFNCMNGENNSTWFVFTAQTTGQIGFGISTSTSTYEDYDWAVWDISANGCQQTITDPPISCNYSAQNTLTGPTGTTTITSGNPGDPPENDYVNVIAGNTYAIVVDNFAGTSTGFDVDFASYSPTSIVDTIPPTMDNVDLDGCGSNIVNISFSEYIDCSQVDPSDFVITGPGGPYSVTAVNSVNCGSPIGTGQYNQDINFELVLNTPMSLGGFYNFQLLANSVTDLCGNTNQFSTYNYYFPEIDFYGLPDTMCSADTAYLINWHTATSPCVYLTVTPVNANSNNTVTLTEDGVASWGTTTLNANTNQTIYYHNISPSALNTLQISNPSAGNNMIYNIYDCNTNALLATAVYGQGSHNLNITGVSGIANYTSTCSSAIQSDDDGTAMFVPSSLTGPFPQTCFVSYSWDDGNGCTGNKPRKVVVLESEDPSFSYPQNTYCQVGSNPVPTAVSPGGTYSSTAGLVIDSNTGEIDLLSSTPGSYTVEYQVANNCITTGSFNVTISPVPTVDAGVDTSICAGDSIQLNGSGSGGTISWTPAVDLSNSGILNPYASPTSTTSYVLSITDALGCEVTDTMVLTVDAAVNLTISSDTTICEGSCAPLLASGATTYAWEPAATLDDSTLANPTACPTATQLYTVYGSNGVCRDTADVTVTVVPAPVVDAGTDVTICFGDTIQLTATGATGYTWTPADSISNTGIANPMVWPSDTTMYYVTGTDGNGCSAIDSVQVNVNPLPTVSAGNDVSYCIGDSIQLNATGADTYVWTPTTDLSDPNIANPYATGTGNMTYIVEGTDANGCVNTDTIDITVNALPVITLSNDTTICENDTITLVAGGGDTYNWNPTTNLGTPTQATTTAFPTTTTTYEVIVTDGNGCIDSAEVVVTVNPAPAVDAGADVTICFGDTIQLTATGATGYTWTPADSISNTGIANPMVWPSDTTIYYVTGSDANSCSLMDSVQVNVNPLPAVFAGNDTSYCIGDSVQLNATGADTYVWTPTTDLSDPNIANPYATGTGNMTYIVEGTDANGCVNTDTIDVTVNALPVITISNDTTICINDTISLTAGGGDTYSWNPTATLGTPSQATTTAFPVTTTTYEAIVTDLNGCVDSAEVDVTVQTLPAVDAGLDVDICFGDTIQLTATGATGYTWAPADSISNINIADPLVWPSDTTEYIVTGADGLNCINTDTVVVNVNPLPTPDAGPDLWVCPGDQVQINATGGGTYSWSPATGLSDPNIDNPMAGPADTTIYILSVTDGNGCIDTDTMTVFVNATVPTDAGTDTTICEGDTIQIGGAPTSVNGTTFFWTPAGLVDDPNASNPMAFPTVDTWFYVATTNDTCSGLDSVLVTVNPYPLANAGADIQICIGDTAQLGATGGVSYVWTPDLDLSDDSIAGPQAWPMDTTAYVVAVTDANGCTQTDTMEVIVNPLPTVSAGADDAICLGDTAQLSASGGDLYTWTPTDSLSDANIFDPMAWPTATTDYMVTVTDSNGCINSDTMTLSINSLPIVDAGADVNFCIGDSVQLGASGADTYVWTPGTDLSDPNIADPWVSSVFTQNYVVEGTDGNGCQNTDTVLVIVNSLPQVDAGADVQLCIGDSVQLQANGADSFVWSPATGLSNATIDDPWASPTDTTEYIVTGTDGNNCVNTDTMTVIVNPLPNAVAGPDVDICLGDSTQLSATGGVSYAWVPSMYVTDSTLADPMAFPDTTMNFTVMVTDSNACINYDTTTVNVFRISTIADTTFCVGDSVQLNVFGSPGNTFVWTPSAGLSDPNIIDPWAAPANTTTYTVTVTDVAGCVDQDSVTINILSAPVASFDTEIMAGCDGAVVEFTNTSIDGISHQWIFGDGTTSDEDDPEHTFPYSENFIATLVVTNSDGCVDTAAFNGATLSFDDYFNIQIPNVFTPNNDGMNDIFTVEIAGKLYRCTNMRVYNRWGQLLFVSTGNNTKWDGYSNVGVAVPAGTYFYTIEVAGMEYKGTLMLMR